MNILHTADWHIGLEINGFSLKSDFDAFINWLTEVCIPEQEIDVLIVSGDIFDKANPSAQARRQYYEALVRLKNTRLKKVILTGGNHDAPHTLDAPAELLRALDIHIVGGVPEDISDLLIPLYEDQKTELIIAAVPFLREGDIRLALAGESTANRAEAVQQALANFFQRIGECTREWKEQGIPVLLMGHLFATGVQVSDSERQIQVGNLGGIDASIFPESFFDYVALGHIHRPQWVGQNPRIRYSGSPLPLSFSERGQQKIVIVIRAVERVLREIKEVPIPVFRQWIRVKGTWEAVKKKTEAIRTEAVFSALLELRIEEEKNDPAILREINAWLEEMRRERKDICIVQHRYHVSISEKREHMDYTEGKALSELHPKEVFESLLLREQVAEEKLPALRQVFTELLESLHQSESL